MRHSTRLRIPAPHSHNILQRLMAQGFAPTLNYFCSIAAFSCLSAH